MQPQFFLEFVTLFAEKRHCFSVHDPRLSRMLHVTTQTILNLESC